MDGLSEKKRQSAEARPAPLPVRPLARHSDSRGAASSRSNSLAARLVEDSTQRRHLHGQIAILDGQARPGRFEERIFGNGGARRVQEQPEQRDRALAQHDRLVAAK